jgi:protein-S-isoprenylcysteine O-methyltransferase Ste14
MERVMLKKRSVLDFLGDALGLVFFGALTLLSAAHLVITGSPLSFGLAVYNALLAVTLAVRETPLRSSTLPEMALGLAGSLLPFISVVPNAVVLNAVVGWAPVGELALLGFALQVIGLVWMIASVAALGKSFGVAPADRGLVASGPYRVVRHPLYLGELVFYAGVLTARPSILHLILWIALAGIQVARLKAEENVINRYGGYVQAVRWRLVPGIW